MDDWADGQGRRKTMEEAQAELDQYEREEAAIKAKSEAFNDGVKATGFGCVKTTNLGKEMTKFTGKIIVDSSFSQEEHDERYPSLPNLDPKKGHEEAIEAFESREKGRARSGTKEALLQGGLVPQEEHDAKVDAAVQDVVFDNYPWESVKKALRERGFVLTKTDVVPTLKKEKFEADAKARNARYHGNAGIDKIETLLKAAQILLAEITLETGGMEVDLQGVESILGSISNTVDKTRRDLEEEGTN